MQVDPLYITNLVSSLDQTQANQQQLSSELSSGVSITSLSQNPVGAGENVLLLNQIQQDDSFTQSAGSVTSQLQVSDSALGSVVSELTQAVATRCRRWPIPTIRANTSTPAGRQARRRSRHRPPHRRP